LIASLLPVSFIPIRSGYPLYMPLVFWAAYAAISLVEIRQLVFGNSTASQVILAATLAVGVWRLDAYQQRRLAPQMNGGSGWANELIAKQLKEFCPRLPRGAKFLFLSEWFPIDDYTMICLPRMLYGDRTLQIDRAKTMTRPPSGPPYTGYDHVFAFDEQDLLEFREGRWTRTPSQTARLGAVAEMNRPVARYHVLRGVPRWSPPDFPWTGPESELQFLFRAPVHEFTAEYFIAEAILSQNGPVSVSFFVNGRPLGTVRYGCAGSQNYAQAVPADWIDPGVPTLVRIQIDKPFRAPDGARLGVVLLRVGFR
jgi:hypothetical protein